MGAFGLNGFDFGFGGPSNSPVMTMPGTVPGIASFSNTQGASDAVSAALKQASTPGLSNQNNWSLDGLTLDKSVTPQSILGDAKMNGIGGSKTAGIDGNTEDNGLGLNLGTGKLALGAVQTIGNLWAAWQANKLAKEQFAYQKNVSEQNLANQIMSYNTSLEDRIRARTAVEAGQAGGMTQEGGQQYLDSHRLVRRA